MSMNGFGIGMETTRPQCKWINGPQLSPHRILRGGSWDGGKATPGFPTGSLAPSDRSDDLGFGL